MKRCWGLTAAIATSAALAAGAASAQARDILVANYNGTSVSVVNPLTGTTDHIVNLSAGTHPWLSAVSPNGKTAYVVDEANNLIEISLVSYTVTRTIPLGQPVNPFQLALSPNGRALYVVSNWVGTSSDPSGIVPINLATGTPGGLITAGTDPYDIVISPNGKTGYVDNYGNGGSDQGSVIPIALTTNTPAAAIPMQAPEADAITPNGSTLWVVDAAGKLYPLNPSSRKLGTPITLPGFGFSYDLAVSPIAKVAYVADLNNSDVYPVTLSNGSVGSTIPVGSQPGFVTFMPDGRLFLTSNYSSVTPIDTATRAAGTSIVSGSITGQIAVIPNQGPKASFKAKVRKHRIVQFNASRSSDPDGHVATYEWRFGDGKSARTTRPKVRHRYRRKGHYRVTLTVVDNEGCSTRQVYSGHQLLCNGGKAASVKHRVKVKVASH